MDNVPFKKAVIVGVGLLGGSLARDLRKHSLAKQIVGVCRSQSSQQRVTKLNIVNQVVGLDQLSDVIKGADLIVLAIPMQAMLDVLSNININAALESECIITDVGSVKFDLQESINKQFTSLSSQVVLAHPIAGAEQSGAEASVENLFVDKHVIITPSEQTDKSKLNRIRNLWTQIGADVLEMDAQQHDIIFSKTSHLPHMIAYALVNFLASQKEYETLFEMAASGFYDFTRIASSDSTMWRDICLTNKQQILNAISAYKQSLETLEQMIEQQDAEQLSDFFNQAKSARNSGLKRKGLKRKSVNQKRSKTEKL